MYKKIKNENNYSINKVGDVRNDLTMKLLKGTVKSNSGYKFYKINNKSIALHRLLALTYVVNKTGVRTSDLVVDHINGIKNDNSLDNLEWVTPQENTIRAGYLQLSKKSKPILVKDFKTGIVTEFRTMVSAAKALGLTRDQISDRVNDKRGSILYPELKQYKYLFDTNDWIDYSTATPDTVLNSNFIKTICYAKNLANNNIIKFYTLTELSNFLNYTTSVMTRFFSTRDQVVCIRKSLKLEKDYFLIKKGEAPWIATGDKYLELEKTSPQYVHIAIMSSDNSLIGVATGLSQIVGRFKMGKSQLHYNLIEKTMKLYNNKYFIYYNDYLEGLRYDK